MFTKGLKEGVCVGGEGEGTGVAGENHDSVPLRYQAAKSGNVLVPR